jgi:hypothetical protein
MNEYIDIALATLSVVGFIILYRQTSQIPFILMAGTLYSKLLFCSFGLIDDIFFIVPELLLTGWLCVLMFKTHEKWMIPIPVGLAVFYVYWLIFVQYHVFGLVGFVFMLVCMVWYIKKHSKFI